MAEKARLILNAEPECVEDRADRLIAAEAQRRVVVEGAHEARTPATDGAPARGADMADTEGSPESEEDPVLHEIVAARRRADAARAQADAQRRPPGELAAALTTGFWAKNEAISPGIRTIHALVPLDDLPANTPAQRVVRDLVVRSLAEEDTEALRAFGEAASLLAGGDPGSMTPNALYAWLKNRPGPPKHEDGTDFTGEESDLCVAHNDWLPRIIAQRAGLVWTNGEFRLAAFKQRLPHSGENATSEQNRDHLEDTCTAAPAPPEPAARERVPGLTRGELARILVCDTRTVSRYRAALRVRGIANPGVDDFLAERTRRASRVLKKWRSG
jgi:hypothetical protein